MYHYTSLGPERFQEFCQALIASAFPNAQCLPVGQRDGGRDAFVMRRALTSRKKGSNNRELVVFQVKYSRSPAEDRSEREVLHGIIKTERPKIAALKEAGLSRYYLMTNVGGTAYPGTGSIDRINEYLTDELEVESYCWWRDDLDRRLDANSSVKWSYPEVLKASDLLEALVSGMLGENEERRRAAIRAYMTAQYEDDEELKFKQVELQGTMTSLFVDLPMAPTREINRQQNLSQFARRAIQQSLYDSEHVYLYSRRPVAKSAEFFLQSAPPSPLSRFVLEGAPGQGKSTVTQYICQIMRMQLLGMDVALEQLPKQHRNARAYPVSRRSSRSCEVDGGR